MNRYDQIGEYLSYLRDEKNLNVCIKDFCGFVPINQELDKVARPFLAHTNPYCMYIKKDKETYHTCLTMFRKMYNKLKASGEGFYGLCHGGLGEYVIPIYHDNMLLGSVNLGFFQYNEERTEFLMRRTCQKHDALEYDIAKDLYDRYIHSPTILSEEILPVATMLAEYLGNTYRLIQSTHSVSRLKYQHVSSNEDTIISHAISYIQENYSKQIAVADLADYCHCSESYISRIFKKRTGVNINVYINKVRVELAKNHLLLSERSITDIALSLGFNDPNYFSRVFSSLAGMPPSEFRRRFQSEANVEENIEGILEANLDLSSLDF